MMNQSQEYVESLIKLFQSNENKVNDKQAAIWAEFQRLGREFNEVDWHLSAQLAQKHKCRIKNCFENCERIARSSDLLTYYEGQAVSIIPMEHAWLVTAGGVVVDPTWVLHPVSNAPDYFGIPLTNSQLLSRGLRGTEREREKT